VPVVALAQAPSAPTLRVVTRGDGVVRTPDPRVRCGSDCSARYKRRAVVVLKASPAKFFGFKRWSGGCVGTAPKCVIALDRSKTVHARFARKTATVSVAVGGRGKVVSEPAGLDCGTVATSCTGTFRQGTTLRLTATPDADGTFGGWGGSVCAGTTATTCEFVVAGNVGASATFGLAAPKPGEQLLTVVPEPGAHVVSVPAGIDCPGVCSASYASGTRVTLSGAGGWAGGCVGEAVDCVIVVDETLGVTARAAVAPSSVFGVNVSVSGPGVVSGGKSIRSKQIRCGKVTGSLLDCEQLFAFNSRVKLKAVPRRGANFARWRGFCSGKKRRCGLRITAPKTVIAYFRR
jgi:Divergent InlB B-repeat domain